MIYADGSGGFPGVRARVVPGASEASARARPSATRGGGLVLVGGDVGAEPRGGGGRFKGDDERGAGASEMTTTTGGGKRVRSAGRSSRKTTRRGEDEDDSAATRADLGEEALKAVAMMDVNASLGDALDLASLDRTDLAKETAKDGSKRRRRSVRLSQGASPAGTHSSVGVTPAAAPGVRRRGGRGAAAHTPDARRPRAAPGGV